MYSKKDDADRQGGATQGLTKLVRCLTLAVLVAGAALILPGLARANNIKISGSMEGSIKIQPGDYVAAGYIFSVSKNSESSQITFAGAQITFSGNCSTGGTGTLTVPINNGPWTVAAGDTSTHPTGNEQDPASFEGSVQAENMCPNNGTLDASQGATFTADLQSTDTSEQVQWLFHYRDPNAKGKGNYDCSATSSASLGSDVCGASWSGTTTSTPDAVPSGGSSTTPPSGGSTTTCSGGATMQSNGTCQCPGGETMQNNQCQCPAGETMAPGSTTCSTPVTTSASTATPAPPVVSQAPSPAAPAVAPKLEIKKLESLNGSTGWTTHLASHVGATIHYRIVVTNAGDTALTSVTLLDTGCVGYGQLPASTSLAPGFQVVYTCTHVLTKADGTQYENTANATAASPTGTIKAGPSSVVATVAPSGVLGAKHVVVKPKKKAPKKVVKKAKPAKAVVKPAHFTG